MLGSLKLLLVTALLVAQLSHAELFVTPNILSTPSVLTKSNIRQHHHHHQQQQQKQQQQQQQHDQHQHHQHHDTTPLSNTVFVFRLFAEPETKQAKMEREQFVQTLKNEGYQFQPQHSYNLGMNAVSMIISKDDADEIVARRLACQYWKPILLSVPLARKQRRAVPDTAQRSRIEPDITSLHKKGLTGKGIRIGFLDDGIDYKHKALGGCFGKGCRVAYGKDYVGDKYDGTKPAAPNKTPIDKCLGHGTHVAGVAAGNSDKVIGVAPDATLGAYRVISCKGYSSTELTARALENAYEDDMDIINISIAYPANQPVDPHLRATISYLLKKNVIIVNSANNHGKQGLWQSRIFGDNPDIISVGSAVSPIYESDWLAIADDVSRPFPYSVMCNAMKPSGTFQLVAIQPVQHRNGECRLPPNIDVNNKIVYIIEVICDPVDLYRQLRELTDNTPAGILVNISEVEPHSPNSAMFCSYHGNGDHASHSPVMMGMLPDRFYAFATELGSRTNVMVNLSRSEERFGGINRISMSHDSTWGPDRHLSFKPDVVAPGVNIFSTAPARLDKYETRSGTSMATPYVAGAIALYLQHHRDEPRKTPVEIRQVLQNAAYPIFSQISRTHPDVAPIAHQGAGFLSVVRMITGKIRVSPSAIPLGDSNNHEWIRDGIRVVPLRITNVDTVARKFYITYHPMQAVRMAWDPQTNRPLLARQSVHVPVEYPTSSIIIGPGATEEVSITIWEPRDLPASWNWVYSGYMAVDTRPIFHLTAPTDKTVFIPFLGLRGSINNVFNS